MAEKLFYSMGEVSEMFDVNASLIRHWESQFHVLRPKRNKKGNRMFSPEDVENLKLIYHMVKEQGMTLDGAKKALKQRRKDPGVARDMELLERLQRVRALLLEVREDLKSVEGDVMIEQNSLSTEVVSSATEMEHGAREGLADETGPGRRTNVVVKINQTEESDSTELGNKSMRRPHRKKGDSDDKELFAFYEQSLF